MIDFQTAFKAKIPFIGIHTVDPVNVKAVLQELTQKKLMDIPAGRTGTIGDFYIYWTESLQNVTAENYKKLSESATSCVVINPSQPSLLMMDVGELPTPSKFYTSYLHSFISSEMMPALVQGLQGLSPKAAQEIVQLTMARTGAITVKEIRKTRQMMGQSQPGLTTLETEYDFYDWNKELKEWLDLNDTYFLDPNAPQKLVPRGLLFSGEPGIGKSMASMVIAKHWDVPLFHLDVSASLDRFLGVSESRIARNLQAIEANAPCVWLLDEVEKLFGTGGDEGTAQRILSQLLWWLQYHRSRVITIMTTNNLTALPKELYRAERVDKVITMEGLTLTKAKEFAEKVYQSLVGKEIPSNRLKKIKEELDHSNYGKLPHAEVRRVVYDMVKKNKWMQE